MLYARGQFAWVKLITHQRLNVEHSSRAIFSELREINITKQMLNYYNELFYQWLVGVTDAEGTFQIVTKNGKWSLVFKLFQHESNKRLLYFIKKRLGVGAIKKSKTNLYYFDSSLKLNSLFLLKLIRIFKHGARTIIRTQNIIS